MFGRKRETRQDDMIKYLANEIVSIRNSQAKQRAELLERIERLETELTTTSNGAMWTVHDIRHVFVQLLDKLGMKMRRRDPWEADFTLVENDDDLKYGSVPHAKKT